MKTFVRRFLVAFLCTMMGAVGACAVWDYNAALQSCVVSHVGDPAGREACLCAAAQDAGRSCDFLDAGADAPAAKDTGAE